MDAVNRNLIRPREPIMARHLLQRFLLTLRRCGCSDAGVSDDSHVPGDPVEQMLGEGALRRNRAVAACAWLG